MGMARSSGEHHEPWRTSTATACLRRRTSMENLKSVSDLCREQQLTPEQLAERAGLDSQRTLAIVLGRWTPSPAERDRIASVFGLSRDQITWGHKTPIQHIYGHGPG
jgi:hypothetical protein